MFQIDQKVGKHTYVYEVRSYWDKEKKAPRQQRVRIGKRDPLSGEIIRTEKKRCSREYGPVYFLASLIGRLGVQELLSQEFPHVARELTIAACFQVAEHKPFYLCGSWIDHIYLNQPIDLPSQRFSRLLQEIGRDDRAVYRFLDDWAERRKKDEFIVFDITSVSTYSRGIDFAEWGYNRDGERLAQINFGVVYGEPSNLPLLYTLYPGSVPDVVTLKNIKKRLTRIADLHTLFVLDRGFYSSSNLVHMAELGAFIIPLPLGTTAAKELAARHRARIAATDKAFRMGKQILYAHTDKVNIEGLEVTAHMIFNEKRSAEERDALITYLLTVEEEVAKRQWKSTAHLMRFLDDNWPEWRRSFSVVQHTSGHTVSRKKDAIETAVASQGIFVLLSNTDLSAEQVLHYYRRKDGVEKLFDSMKHGTALKRLRVHSRRSLEGLLFIEFLSLIIYSEIQRVLRDSGLEKKLTVEQMFYELRKLSVIEIDEKKPMITELTRKQKDIFNAFGIPLPIST